jgi:hypothetical protein
MEQKRTPLIPLTEEELDTADAALTGRPTLAETHGWTKEEYSAVGAAIDEQRWKQPGKQLDPEMMLVSNRIDHNGNSVHDRPIRRENHGEQPIKHHLQRLGNAKAQLAMLDAEHHAATLMTGDRRYKTLRRIEKKIGEATKYKNDIECALQKLSVPTELSVDPHKSRQNEANFYARTASYQRIVFLGHEYTLTPLAGAIVKVLHEANGKPVAAPVLIADVLQRHPPRFRRANPGR